jgi:hypothetical protein
MVVETLDEVIEDLREALKGIEGVSKEEIDKTVNEEAMKELKGEFKRPGED